MFKTSNAATISIGKNILLGAILCAIGLGSAYAKKDNEHYNQPTTSNRPNTPNTNTNSNNNPNITNPFSNPSNQQPFDSTAYVNFAKRIVRIPCLQIQGLAPNINGSFFNVKLETETNKSFQNWKVTSATPMLECSTPVANPFLTTTKPTSSSTYDATAIRHPHTVSTNPFENPGDPTINDTAFVDFTKEIIEIPCLIVKGYGLGLDGSYFNVQMKPLFDIKTNYLDWKVVDATSAPECNTNSYNPFILAPQNLPNDD